MVATNFDLAAYLGLPVWLLVLITAWSLAWMGVAMWKSARKSNMVWFIIFLLVHTLGILEILYIFVFSKMSSKPAPQAARKRRR